MSFLGDVSCVCSPTWLSLYQISLSPCRSSTTSSPSQHNQHNGPAKVQPLNWSNLSLIPIDSDLWHLIAFQSVCFSQIPAASICLSKSEGFSPNHRRPLAHTWSSWKFWRISTIHPYSLPSSPQPMTLRNWCIKTPSLWLLQQSNSETCVSGNFPMNKLWLSIAIVGLVISP